MLPVPSPDVPPLPSCCKSFDSAYLATLLLCHEFASAALPEISPCQAASIHLMLPVCDLSCCIMKFAAVPGISSCQVSLDAAPLPSCFGSLLLPAWEQYCCAMKLVHCTYFSGLALVCIWLPAWECCSYFPGLLCQR